MADSLKSRWSVSGNESCSCLVPTECRRDGCDAQASSSDLSREEAVDAVAVRTQVLSQARTTPEPLQSRVATNPTAWEPFHPTSGFHSTPTISLTNLQAHGIDLATVRSSVNSVIPIVAPLGQVTSLRDADAANSSIDRSSQHNVLYPFLSFEPFPRVTSPSSPSQSIGYHISPGQPTLPPSYPDQENRTDAVTHLPVPARSVSTPPTLVPGTFHDHSRGGLVVRSRHLVDGPEISRLPRGSPTSHQPGDLDLSRWPSSENETLDRFESALHLYHRIRRPGAQDELPSEGSGYSSSSSASGPRLTPPVVRHGSTIHHRLRSPSHVGSDDGDGLPALLSMTDVFESELGRATSPDTATDVSSQASSEDSRSRFLHPGTPIQTELPEIRSLLQEFRAEERNPVHHVWRLLEARLSSDHSDNQVPWEDDLTGDMERAKELLDSLELVDEELVERYQKVRGEGDDICAICRDPLLRPICWDKPSLESAQTDAFAAGNIAANAELPFQLPCAEMSIYAFPCTHLFHMNCLLPWLSLKTTCPTCRLDLDPCSLTLRVREWGRTPLLSQNPSRGYVNTDNFGRRIPWQPPSGPSLEEWVRNRESTSSEQHHIMKPRSVPGRDTTENERGKDSRDPISSEPYTGFLPPQLPRVVFPEHRISTRARENTAAEEYNLGQEGHVATLAGSALDVSLWQSQFVPHSDFYQPSGDSMSRRGDIFPSNTHFDDRRNSSPLHPLGDWPVMALSATERHRQQLPIQGTFVLRPTAPPLVIDEDTDSWSTAGEASASVSASRQAAVMRTLGISSDFLNQVRRTPFDLDRSAFYGSDNLTFGASTSPTLSSAIAAQETDFRRFSPDHFIGSHDPNTTQ